MIESLFLAAALMQAQPAPVAAAEGASPASFPEFSQEDRARLRCAAAFSIVAARDGGELAVRGKEFFVVTLAGLMDTYELDREAVTRAVRSEAQKLADAGEVDAVMPACLLMLQASGI